MPAETPIQKIILQNTSSLPNFRATMPTSGRSNSGNLGAHVRDMQDPPSATPGKIQSRHILIERILTTEQNISDFMTGCSGYVDAKYAGT